MPRLKLTKARVERAEHLGGGNQTLYQDTELPGFALRVTAAGAKSYVIEYRRAGRRRRVTLGKHGPLAPDQARRLAQRELGTVAAGEDPAERRRLERAGDSFGDVKERYLDDLKARAEAGARRGRLSGWESSRGLADRHLPPGMLRRKVSEISADDVRRLHRALADKPATADHVRTLVHAVLELARTEGLIDANPAAAVRRYAKPSKRRRALSLDELGRLGSALEGVEQNGTADGHRVSRAAATALRLLALTGMRKSELLGHHTKARRGPREGLRWGDIDLEAATYTLAAVGGGSGGKGGEPRTLPLGRPVVELLRDLRPEDVGPDVPIVPSPRDPAAPFVGLDKPRRRVYREADIEDADAHCLRHTFETMAFSVAPSLAGALTGRAITRDRALNAYIHVDADLLQDAADRVAGRIDDALGGRSGLLIRYGAAGSVGRS